MRTDSPLAEESTFLTQEVTSQAASLAAAGQTGERLDVSYRGMPSWSRTRRCRWAV